MKYLNIFILFFLGFIIFFRYYFSLPIYKSGDLVKITTTVLTEPLIFNDKQYLKLEGLKIYLPRYPEITYGDRLEIIGTVDDKKLQNPTLKTVTLIQKLEKEDTGVIFKLRNKLITFYKSNLPEPYSSLISGITIGSKQMPEKFWDVLRSTGTAHVVVASGTNVTMLASFLIASLTNFIKRRLSVFISIAVIVLYVFISGFDAPIVRASIMGIILLFGQSVGRVTDTWRILLYTSISMILIKPAWISDLGFILSFTATTSLLLFQKRVDTYFRKLPNILREGFSTSIAAQIGVAPIIFVTFGQFNPLSPLINGLILWTVPYIMSLGMVAGLMGLLVPLIGRLILFVIFPFLYFFVQTILIFGF